MSRRRGRRRAAVAACAGLVLAGTLAGCERRDHLAARGAPGVASDAPLARLEILTGDAREGDPLPLVVAIHGLGDTPRGLATLFADFEVPSRVVLPHAEGSSWFPLPWETGGDAAFERGVAAAAARIAVLLEALPQEWPTLGRPVVTGFSQGGILAFAVATARPELVSAALPIAGALPPGLWPRALPRGATDAPLRALHGGRDDVLPLAPTEALVVHLRGLGFDAELRSYPEVGHHVSREMLRDYHGLLGQAIRRASAAPGAARAAPEPDP